MMQRRPADKQATRLPVVTTTITIDLSQGDRGHNRQAVSSLSGTWPGSRIHVVVGDRSPYDTDGSVPHLLAEVAIERALVLDFDGEAGAVADWAHRVRDIITSRLVSA